MRFTTGHIDICRFRPWGALILALWGGVMGACSRDEATRASVALAAETWPSVTEAEGQALVEQYECHRCHLGTRLDAPVPAKDCGGCHRQIAKGRFTVPIEGGHPPDDETLAEWKEHTRHLIHVPDLGGATARLRRDWLAAFLEEPHDVRPGLEETMPRLPISDADARKLAAHLTLAPAPEPRVGGYSSRGRRLLEDEGCTACHQFTGVPPLRVGDPPDLAEDELVAAMALAPDLRYARSRMTPATMVSWIMDPPALQPGASMPKQDVARRDAEHIVTYLTTAPLAPSARAEPLRRLPRLKRDVTFEDVSQEVLRGSCWHCHSDPDYAFGDGGPGNTGGFGFEGKGIELATYEGVLSGYVDDDGRRRGLVQRDERGRSRLVESLLARHEEDAGSPRDGLLGMPLGLPPLTGRQIQLVESWVAQGAPR